MKRNHSTILKLFILLGSILWTASACSGSSATPPASIPAPVSGLIAVTQAGSASSNLQAAIQNVDIQPKASTAGTGILIVQGADGAVEANALVSVTNISASPNTSCSVEATSAGGFGAGETCQLAGVAGDSLEIKQTIDGEESDAATITADAGAFAVDGSPVVVSSSSGDNRTYVGYTEGGETFLDVYNTDTQEFSETLTFSNFIVSAMDFDNISGEGALIDATEDLYMVVSSDGTVNGSAPVGSTDALSVVTLDGEDAAVVGHSSNAAILTFYDNSGGLPTAAGFLTALTHPDTGATHDRTFALSFDTTAGSALRVGALSLFDNGDTVFTLVDAVGSPTFSLSASDQVNLGSNTYGTLQLYNDATEVVTVDRSNDELVRLSGTSFATIERLSVGSDPIDVIVSEADALAYVLNNDDHSISVVDLTNFEVDATLDAEDGLGLGPIALDFDDDPFTLIIINDLTSSVSLIDL